MLKKLIIKEQYLLDCQPTVTNFIIPVRRPTPPASDYPQPGASNDSENVISDTETMKKIASFLNLVNSVNALYILLRMVISFYLYYINTLVLSRLFHYPDRFLHHLVQKNKGRVYCSRLYALLLVYC